jgi:hypothetical protein
MTPREAKFLKSKKDRRGGTFQSKQSGLVPEAETETIKAKVKTKQTQGTGHGEASRSDIVSSAKTTFRGILDVQRLLNSLIF